MKANNLSTSSILIKLLACIILIGFLVIGYTLIVRPWYSKWGTTKDELTMIMPGDEIIVNPVWDYTQAITIHAPAAEIWQWLVQIGQGRGGFYSFELLENLIGCDIQNTDRIMPEFQHLTIGDSIKLHPEAPGIPVVLVDSAKAIVMGGSDESQLNASSWSFLLQGLDVSNSRLIARFRSSYSPTLGNILLQRIFVQPTSLFMQKRMMIGIKQRAEGTFRSSVSENIQAILWLLIFGLMIVILISISIRRDWIRLFLIGLLAGLMLLLFIAWQPPIWIGITMVILLLFGMVWAVRQH
jgi:hypothetical protein